MQNKYLSYDDQRAPKVREMFSRLARRYDLVNDVMSFGMHRRWKRQTVALALAGRPRARILDLCCGTGDMAFYAESRDPRLRIVGVDFTLPMLVGCPPPGPRLAAPARNWSRGMPCAFPFRTGPSTPSPSATGCATSPTSASAIGEMRRVLAPGGRVVVLDFGKPDNPVAAALYGAFLRTMMPAVGWLFHGDPETYLYIPASLEKFAAQRGVERMMREAGLVEVGYENRLLGTMGLNVGTAPR